MPSPPRFLGTGFTEFTRRHGDFALGGAAVVVGCPDGQRCERASIALLGAACMRYRAVAGERMVVWPGGVDVG